MERERAAGAQAEAVRLRGKRRQAERLPYNFGEGARRQSGVATTETAAGGAPALQCGETGASQKRRYNGHAAARPYHADAGTGRHGRWDGAEHTDDDGRAFFGKGG